MEIILSAQDVRAMSKLINPKSERYKELSIFAHNGDMLIIAGDTHAMGILKCYGDIPSGEEWAFAIPYDIAKALPGKGVIEVVLNDASIVIHAGDASYTVLNVDQAGIRRKCLKVLQLVPDEVSATPGVLANPEIMVRFLALQSVYISGKGKADIRIYPSRPAGVAVIPDIGDRFVGVFGPLAIDKTDTIETFAKEIRWIS